MEKKLLNPKLLSMLGMGGAIFGSYLPEIVKENPKILILSADMSSPAGLDKFKAAFPDNFINVGIAEQNMIGIAAGLSNEGYKCICVAQSCFITMRAYEMVRQFCGYMGIPLILIGIGGGFSLGYMGNTHYALEDIALMRTIPGMTVITPADSLEAVKVFEEALTMDSPVYIRLQGGAGWPSVHTADIDLIRIGKGILLKEGGDCSIIASGSMVRNALQSAEILEGEGIKAEVINMPTLKPIDAYMINTDNRIIFTIEEHRPIGGLGDAVADIIAKRGSGTRLVKLSVDETYPIPGDYNYLVEQANLSATIIAEKIKKEITN